MLDMLSVPPATTMSALPVMMVWAPMMRALTEEAQTLFMVVEMVDSGRPAPMGDLAGGVLAQAVADVRIMSEVMVAGVALGGQDIANEDLLHVLGLEACTLDSS